MPLRQWGEEGSWTIFRQRKVLLGFVFEECGGDGPGLGEVMGPEPELSR